MLAIFLLTGCGAREGNLSNLQPADAGVPRAPQAVPVNFHYAPQDTTYYYTSTTITNSGGSNSHTSELQFAVKISKGADRYTAEATLEKSLVDGGPTPGITESMLKGFKLTTVLDPHGAITSSERVGTDGFVGQEARDLGTSFSFPNNALKPGDQWNQDRGSYTVTFKFVGIETSGNRRVAKFEERGSDAQGGKVDQPTLISIDADTGVLIDKVAETVIPSGPNATDPLVPVRSEIKLR